MLRQWQTECIELVLDKYKSGNKHFLAQATPGAGKTIMAASLVKRLLSYGMVDLVICFSPSRAIAGGIRETFSRILGCTFNGNMGTVGSSITYQSLRYIKSDFWSSLKKHRVLVIFDEVHHCCGDSMANANAWGEQNIVNIQAIATYTLAITGTPWRSDSLPISLCSYSDAERRIVCDYQYTLREAIADKVCRKPALALVDSQNISVLYGQEKHSFGSINDLLKEGKALYSDILYNHDALFHILALATTKLLQVRKQNPRAGGVIIASSVRHAHCIGQMLEKTFNQSCEVVSYSDEEAQLKIHKFRNKETMWIVSIGMVSEGTDIPRLQVCCYLSNVKTELYFRQVLGRITRRTDTINQEAWFFTFAEENLTKYAEEISNDIPNSCFFIKKKTDNEYSLRNCNINEAGHKRHKPDKNEPSLSWNDACDEPDKKQPRNGNKQASISLGGFQERVIYAFSYGFNNPA